MAKPVTEATDDITYGTWPRGVDYSRPADEVGNDSLFSMENCRVGSAGEARKRNGCDNVNASALNSAATVTAIGKHRFSAASSATFAVAGDKFYEDIAGTPADRTNGATITAGDDRTWKFTNAGGTMVGHNGVSGDTLIKWAASGNTGVWDVDSRFTTVEWVEWWDRRVWAGNLSSGVNRVWRSDTDDVETWGATNFYTFDSDVTGIKRWVVGVVVHTTNTIAFLSPTGDASTPYRRNDVILGDDGEGGTVSGRAIANVPGLGQCFPRRDGFYAFTGQQKLVKISQRLDGARYWDSINKDRLSESFVQVYPVRNEVWWWLPYGSGQTNMNHVIILNWSLTAQVGHPVWYGPDVDLTRNCAALIDDLPNFGGFDGFVYEHDTGTDDNGTAIDAFFETGSTAPFGGNVDCEWKSVRAFFEVTGIHTVEVTEQSPDITSSTQDMRMGGSYDGLGTFKIGVSAIAGDNQVTYAQITLSGKSPFKKYRVRNGNAGQTFVFRRFVSNFNPVGRVRRDRSGVH